MRRNFCFLIWTRLWTASTAPAVLAAPADASTATTVGGALAISPRALTADEAMEGLEPTRLHVLALERQANLYVRNCAVFKVHLTCEHLIGRFKQSWIALDR